MHIEGAIIKEQGITFAIVTVKRSVLDSTSSINDMRASLSIIFPGIPIILMVQDSSGTPTFQGRKDIVNFLVNISIDRIQWKRYTIN